MGAWNEMGRTHENSPRLINSEQKPTFPKQIKDKIKKEKPKKKQENRFVERERVIQSLRRVELQTHHQLRFTLPHFWDPFFLTHHAQHNNKKESSIPLSLSLPPFPFLSFPPIFSSALHPKKNPSSLPRAVVSPPLNFSG